MKRISLLAIVLSAFALSCSHKEKTAHITTAGNYVEMDRSPASSTPWTTWSEKGTVGALLELKEARDTMMKIGLHDPHQSYKGYGNRKCTFKDDEFRSADGTCYYMDKPYVGAAGVAFGRNVAPEFIDKNAEKNLMNPSPALISKELMTRDKFKEVPFLNMLAASWIQFMNHDWITHGKNNSSKKYSVKGAPSSTRSVEGTKENPVSSRNYKSSFGKTHLNTVTHWWDGSQIYGSSQDTQDQLRTGVNGMMKLRKVGNGRYRLPTTKLDIRSNKQNFGYELTGFRENWWVGLSMLHLLFVKEHNAIAEMLREEYVSRNRKKGKKWVWDQRGFFARNGVGRLSKRTPKGVKYLNDAELDEHLFQMARLINAAVMAKIHTVEWTPAILPNKVLKTAMYTNWYGLANAKTWFKGLPWKADFNPFQAKGNTVLSGIVGNGRVDGGVPYSLTEEFTSVYRLHPLLPENINFQKLGRPGAISAMPLIDTRNEKSSKIMDNNDVEDLFYSFGRQKPGQLTLNNFPAFMQNLTIPGFGKMDLAMVDILRDRERGVPRYNQFRRGIGLTPIKSYRDFFPANKKINARQRKVIEKFEKIYGKNGIEQIDLLVGILAEEVRPKNFGFGETQFQIFLLMASRRLMADKFYTEFYDNAHYTKAGLAWIDKEGRMDKVIGRHMPKLKPKMKGLDSAFYPWKK